MTSTFHGLTAGSDTGATMLRIGVLMTAALFAGLTAARIIEAADPTPRPNPRPKSLRLDG